MEGWKFWWGIAAFFLGGLSTQLNSWLGHRRQQAEKAREAAEGAVRRRNEFELEHLVATNQRLHDLREAFLDVANAIREIRLARASNRPTSDARLTVANEGLEAAESSLHGHVGFILDEAVRAAVREAMEQIDFALADVLTEDAMPFGEVGRAVNLAFDALSARVRNLYAVHPPHS